MKLVIATPLYPPESGGPATYARLLEEELPARGIEVSLVAFSLVRGYPKGIRHIAYFFTVAFALRKADAVLALDPVSTGLPAALAARLLGKQFFVKIVGDYAWEQGVQRFGIRAGLDDFVRMEHVPFPVRMLQDVERWVALRAKKIIVPSQYLKRIVEAWRIKRTCIEVVHNAVSVEHIGTVPEAVAALPRPLVVSVGRLVPWKGMKGLIDAVERARETMPVSLALVGDGPESSALTAWAHKKLGDGYVLTGRLSHEDTLAVLQHADVCALNTSYEGLSHLLIEALSLGVPIITTPVGGNSEVVEDGKSGLLVPVDDRDAWSAALRRVISDGAFRAHLSKGAKESSEHFRAARTADLTAKLLTTPV